jgi:hypothetical protein
MKYSGSRPGRTLLRTVFTYVEFSKFVYTSEFWMIQKFSNPEHFRQFSNDFPLQNKLVWNLLTRENYYILHNLIFFLCKYSVSLNFPNFLILYNVLHSCNRCIHIIALYLSRARHWEPTTTFVRGYLGRLPIYNVGWVRAVTRCWTHLYTVQHIAHISSRMNKWCILSPVQFIIFFLLLVAFPKIAASWSRTLEHINADLVFARLTH